MNLKEYDYQIQKKLKALVIVDLQNDFLPGGTLEVPEGDKIIDKINDILDNYDLIIASQAYRAASSVKLKVSNVIGPLMRLLNQSGKLLITHSLGGENVQKILKVGFKDIEAFPNEAKNIIEFLKNNPFGENNI